jgi:hypothetical protein
MKHLKGIYKEYKTSCQLKGREPYPKKTQRKTTCKAEEKSIAHAAIDPVTAIFFLSYCFS